MSIYTGLSDAQFGRWVFDIDDKLEAFIGSLYGDVKQQLDYSVASLDAAEQWLLKTYKTPDAIDALHRAITVDGFCRYVGEVFRRHVGGTWDMVPASPDPTRTVPHLRDGDRLLVSPWQLLKAALTEKTGVLMSSRLRQLL